MKKLTRRVALAAASLTAAIGISLVPSAAQAGDTGWPTSVPDGVATTVGSAVAQIDADTGWPVSVPGGVRANRDTGWPT